MSAKARPRVGTGVGAQKIDKKALLESLREKHQTLTDKLNSLSSDVSEARLQLDQDGEFVKDLEKTKNDLEEILLEGQNNHDEKVVEYHKRCKEIDQVVKSMRSEIDSLFSQRKTLSQDRSACVTLLTTNDKKSRQLKREITGKRNAILKSHQDECPSYEFEAPVLDSTLNTLCELEDFVKTAVEKLRQMYSTLQRVLTLKSADFVVFSRLVRHQVHQESNNVCANSTIATSSRAGGRASRRQSMKKMSAASQPRFELLGEEGVYKQTESSIRVVDRSKVHFSDSKPLGEGSIFGSLGCSTDSGALASRLDFPSGNNCKVDWLVNTENDLKLSWEKFHMIHSLLFKDEAAIDSGKSNIVDGVRFIKSFCNQSDKSKEFENSHESICDEELNDILQFSPFEQFNIEPRSSDAIIDLLGSDARILTASKSLLLPFLMRRLITHFPQGLPVGLSSFVTFPLEAKILSWEASTAVDNTLRAVSHGGALAGRTLSPVSTASNVLINMGSTCMGSRGTFWRGVVQSAVDDLFERIRIFNANLPGNSQAKKLRVMAIMQQVNSIRPSKVGDSSNSISTTVSGGSLDSLNPNGKISLSSSLSNKNLLTDESPATKHNALMPKSAVDLAATIHQRLALVRGDATTEEEANHEEENGDLEGCLEDILKRRRKQKEETATISTTEALTNDQISSQSTDSESRQDMENSDENKENESPKIQEDKKENFMNSQTTSSTKQLLDSARQSMENQADWESFLSKFSFKSRQELNNEKSDAVTYTSDKLNHSSPKFFDSGADLLTFLAERKNQHAKLKDTWQVRRMLAKRLVASLPQFVFSEDEPIPSTPAAIEQFLDVHCGENQILRDLCAQMLREPDTFVKQRQEILLANLLEGFGVHSVIRLRLIEVGCSNSEDLKFNLSSSCNTVSALPATALSNSKDTTSSALNNNKESNNKGKDIMEEEFLCGPGGELLIVDVATDEDALSSFAAPNQRKMNNAPDNCSSRKSSEEYNIFHRNWPLGAFSNPSLPRDPVVSSVFSSLIQFSNTNVALSNKIKKQYFMESQGIGSTSLSGSSSSANISATNNIPGSNIIETALIPFLKRITGEEAASNIPPPYLSTCVSRLALSLNPSSSAPAPMDIATLKLANLCRLNKESLTSENSARNLPPKAKAAPKKIEKIIK
eukprot:GDKJ01040389.1.p1 GENE.GDKJ01040389.1~~GDKJ01040389.1.p1  ORF type:complete len:1166 (-),score=288.94 GDKJ01040389.1:82-3579(-)